MLEPNLKTIKGQTGIKGLKGSNWKVSNTCHNSYHIIVDIIISCLKKTFFGQWTLFNS